MNYRKLWESNFGTIPSDEFGRTYEIHHKVEITKRKEGSVC